MTRVNRVSPGITTREINLTQTVSANSGLQSAVCGLYGWGPVDVPTLLDSENEQVQIFGEPNDANFATWFLSAEFLAENAGCFVTRIVPADAYNASLGGVGIAGTVDSNVVNGEVASVAINTAGSGYTVGDIVTITGGSVSLAEAQITAIDGAGGITGIDLKSNGSGYAAAGTGVALISKNDFVVKNFDEYNDGNLTLPEVIASYPGELGNNIGVTVVRASEFYGNQFETSFSKAPTAVEQFFDGDGITETFTLGASFLTATDVEVTVNGVTIAEGVNPGEWQKTASVLSITPDIENFNGDGITSEFVILNVNELDLFTSHVVVDGVTLIADFNKTGHIPIGYFDIDPSTGLLTVGTNLETLSGDGTTTVRSITTTDSITAANVRVYVDGVELSPVAIAPAAGEVQVESAVGGYDFTFFTAPGSGIGNIEIEWGFPIIGVDNVAVTYGLPLGDESLKVFHTQTGVHVVVYDRETNKVLERYTNLSTESTSKFANGISNYYPEYVSRVSSYIRITGDMTNFGDSILTGGANGSALTDADYQNAFARMSNKEDFDIQYLIDPCVSANVSQYLINIAETREDAVAFVGSTQDVTVANPGRELNSILDFAALLPTSSYGIFNPTWIRIYDRYNAKERWIPSTGTDAGLYARTHRDNNLWTATAGYTRGSYRRARQVSFLPSEAQQNTLYANDINYVKRNKGVGFFLFGQKTLARTEDAFNRANVRFLSIHIKRGVSDALKFAIGEINDEITRASVRNLLNPFMRDIFAQRGVYEYDVRCDGDNNPAEVIDANELIVQIYLQPTRTVEFIGLELIYTQTGISFQEVRLTN